MVDKEIPALRKICKYNFFVLYMSPVLKKCCWTINLSSVQNDLTNQLQGFLINRQPFPVPVLEGAKMLRRLHFLSDSR